ncbi:MAG: hypothetical protein NTU76_01365 [Candidatus Taylorbacteria bacterium]|nr:hypothetical protein [Candidatus Taylorbacteria bacterium]
MNKSLKQNWPKLGIILLIVIIIFSFAHYLGRKNRFHLKKVDLGNDRIENQEAIKKDNPDGENIEPKQSAGSNNLDEILSKNLEISYSLAEKPTDIPEAIGLNFELPKDYEIAISKNYSSKEKGDFKILGLRQVKSDTLRDPYPVDGPEEQYIPAKPVMVAIVDKNNIIKHFIALSDYPFFQGNNDFNDYKIESINKSIEFKDLNGDGIQEILIYAYKPYAADYLISLSTISLNKNDDQGTSFKTQKLFKSTYKDSFRLVERNGTWFVAEADSGVGDCRLCPTVYMINIYEFSNYQNPEIEDNFTKIATVASEKEFGGGDDVLDYKMAEINKKLDLYKIKKEEDKKYIQSLRGSSN